MNEKRREQTREANDRYLQKPGITQKVAARSRQWRATHKERVRVHQQDYMWNRNIRVIEDTILTHEVTHADDPERLTPEFMLALIRKENHAENI